MDRVKESGLLESDANREKEMFYTCLTNVIGNSRTTVRGVILDWMRVANEVPGGLDLAVEPDFTLFLDALNLDQELRRAVLDVRKEILG